MDLTLPEAGAGNRSQSRRSQYAGARLGTAAAAAGLLHQGLVEVRPLLSQPLHCLMMVPALMVEGRGAGLLLALVLWPL
jgi:hypothetical protein